MTDGDRVSIEGRVEIRTKTRHTPSGWITYYPEGIVGEFFVYYAT